jgi:hypothetical protein
MVLDARLAPVPGSFPILRRLRFEHTLAAAPATEIAETAIESGSIRTDSDAKVISHPVVYDRRLQRD